MYYNNCFLWRYQCWVWKKKQHDIDLPTFKLPASS